MRTQPKPETFKRGNLFVTLTQYADGSWRAVCADQSLRGTQYTRGVAAPDRRAAFEALAEEADLAIRLPVRRFAEALKRQERAGQ